MVVLCRLTCSHNLLQRFTRQRHYWKNMDCDLLEPPAAVHGMCVLDRDAFQKRVQLPRLRVREEQANKVLPLLKKLMLKMEKLPPVRVLKTEANDNNETPSRREVLLHPLAVKDWGSLPTDELTKLGVEPTDFYYDEVALNYENWRADEILKSVLSPERDSLTSYSRIGHIVHLNLRDHLLPYKSVIGQVLHDKVAGCRTVVNKAATIDNTYRNFQLELICGVPEYQVETKENGVVFEFDFSRVYWNPRLSTEHERIVHLLNPGDVLYDVFAGVGPFSVPAARKRCWVLANDLNPESYRWLQHNGKRNKCLNYMKSYNKDGRDFLHEIVKPDLLKRWKEQQAKNAPADYAMHITMNLPAMAVEFLDAFRGLLQQQDVNELNELSGSNFNFPMVHVYSFAKGEDTKVLVRALVEEHLGLPLADKSLSIHFVRNVAPNKDMYRVTFPLTKEILTTPITTKNIATPTEDEKSEAPTRKRTASEVASELEQRELATKVKCT